MVLPEASTLELDGAAFVTTSVQIKRARVSAGFEAGAHAFANSSAGTPSPSHQTLRCIREPLRDPLACHQGWPRQDRCHLIARQCPGPVFVKDLERGLDVCGGSGTHNDDGVFFRSAAFGAATLLRALRDLDVNTTVVYDEPRSGGASGKEAAVSTDVACLRRPKPTVNC